MIDRRRSTADRSWQKIDGSGDRFGYEWSRYATILPEHEAQFLGWTVHLSPDEWRGLRFLDVGCGMGRNALWPMRYGARSGVLIDVDDRSLDAARDNLSAYADIRVLKASAYSLPFVDEFDIAFSIGVLQFLADPSRALASMVSSVRPGGRVMIWVYGRENNGWIIRIWDPARRHVFTRIPIGPLHALSILPASLLWVVLRMPLPLTGYFRLARSFSFQHLRSIVFDHMLPRRCAYWTRDEVEALLRQAGLQDVRLAHVNGVSWSAIGTRPSRQ